MSYHALAILAPYLRGRERMAFDRLARDYAGFMAAAKAAKEKKLGQTEAH